MHFFLNDYLVNKGNMYFFRYNMFKIHIFRCTNRVL